MKSRRPDLASANTVRTPSASMKFSGAFSRRPGGDDGNDTASPGDSPLRGCGSMTGGVSRYQKVRILRLFDLSSHRVSPWVGGAVGEFGMPDRLPPPVLAATNGVARAACRRASAGRAVDTKLPGKPERPYTRRLASSRKPFVHPLRPSSTSGTPLHESRCTPISHGQSGRTPRTKPGLRVGGDAVALIRQPATSSTAGVSSLRLDPGAPRGHRRRGFVLRR